MNRQLVYAALLTILAMSGCKKVESDSATSISALADVQAPEISEEIMKRVTKTLSSDEFEGRAPGTVGEEKTLALLSSEFEKAGLKPGNKGSWYQNVGLVEINAENVSPLTIFSADGTQMQFAPAKDFVAVSYRQETQVDVTGSDIVFVGYGVHAPQLGWDDYAGVDVKGKTVLILVNDPDFGTQSLEGTFGGRAMTYYGRWTYKFEEAARQGAAAALVIHDTKPASYGWNVVESSWSGPQFYADTKSAGADQTLANGWVHLDTAKKMFAAAGIDMQQAMKDAQLSDFSAMEMGLKASVSLQNKITKTNSQNVIGILEGSKRPHEYVVYTAHWDHLGRCTPAPDGDDICNGAIDNATGTAALVALAKAFDGQNRPERSLIFLAVTAEESGLLGSKYYAENPVYPLSQTVGGVNMDALSMAGPARNISVIGYGKSALDDYLKAAADVSGLRVEPEATPEKGFYYRSDHFSFAKLGVPMLYFSSGNDLIDGRVAAGKAAGEDYGKNRYHQPSDEYDESWDWTGVMADLQLYYSIGHMLAMSDAWPNWREGDEFRAARDKSRAGE